MLKHHGLGFVALILAISLAPPLMSGAEMGVHPDPTSTWMTPPVDVEAAVQELTQPLDTVPLPPLPIHPFGALIGAINALSASRGFAVDHGPAIWASGMSPEYAGRVALLLQAVLNCDAATTAVTRLDCAVAVNDAAAGVIRTPAPSFRDVQAWPILYIDGNRSNDNYVHDYTVLIDRGGNDVYDNNAGGNLQDIKFGPAGSPAPNVGKAIGCEQVQGNFPAPTATAHDCIAAPQVVFIDYASNGRRSDDAYGVFKSPRKKDHNPPLDPITGLPVPRKVDGDCTRDQLIRRMVLQGSGFEGNGMLIDVGGDDWYRGKTAAQGSGHIGGVGVLRDLGRGSDNYLAIRNSQGFALVGTLGLAQDDGGDDKYYTYMPSPRDRRAEFQEDGSGGVVDDTGLCDNLPRMVQGAALLGGIGYLLNEDGRDVYVGAPQGTQPFMPGILFFHSSQGFGCDTGVGILIDRGGDRDKYSEGPGGRADGVSISEAETACFAVPGLSIFRDDGR